MQTKVHLGGVTWTDSNGGAGNVMDTITANGTAAGALNAPIFTATGTTVGGK